MPLLIVVLFWTGTLLLYMIDVFGVYADARNNLLLLTFVTLHILILIGVNYLRASHITPVLTDHRSAVRLFYVSLLISSLMLPYNVYYYTGASFTDFFTLFSDPMLAYSKMQIAVAGDRSERIEFLMVKIALSGITILLVPLAIILKKSRFISLPTMIFALSMSFILSVFRGTDKEVGDIVIFMIAGVFLTAPTAASARQHYLVPKKSKQRFLSKWIMATVGVVIFLTLFSFRKGERLANLSYHCFTNTNICMEYPPPGENPLQFVFTLLYRYTTQGYYGLSTTFDATTTYCPFIGHSKVLSYFAELFGTSCVNTIHEQVNNLGWSSRGAWSTGFTSLANDFGHAGTYLYVLFFALSLKIFYHTYTVQRCYISGVLYMLNFFILFYMPCNLQLQQVGEQYFGYIILNLVVFARVLTHRRIAV